ncbi:MAG: hypothetical protein GWP06_16425, partial [Actinobacteria bacterium]|nr:hypothetical protein [Actinomycetota bacterium]
MKRKKLLWYVVLLCVTGSLAQAQDSLPREYVPPVELVSLKSDLDFSIAMDLLSEFSIKFSGKPIHDPLKRTGPIGIDIQQTPWQKALGLILSKRGLWYVEKAHFFEIIVPNEEQSGFSTTPVSKLAESEKLSPLSREVKIEATFFQGDRTSLKEIGIDWSTFYQGEVDLTAKQVGALSLNEDVVSLNIKVPNKLFGIDINALLRIFDSENIGKVLAQPHIVVVEGKEGNIQVGQDFSIKQRDFAGNITDRFYSTGTIMQVTPFIFQDKDKGSQIILKIHVERSQAYPDVVSTIIKKSQADSYVQLYDGEETLIGGLYSTETAALRKGIPLLKDLPWWFLGIRYLFGYNRNEAIEKELIIIIKASLLPDVMTRARESKISQQNRNSLENLKLKIQQIKKSNLINQNALKRPAKKTRNYSSAASGSQSMHYNNQTPKNKNSRRTVTPAKKTIRNSTKIFSGT